MLTEKWPVARGKRNKENGWVFVDFQSRENGSIYRAFFEPGMRMHIDFRYNPETRNTAGTTITPLL